MAEYTFECSVDQAAQALDFEPTPGMSGPLPTTIHSHFRILNTAAIVPLENSAVHVTLNYKPSRPRRTIIMILLVVSALLICFSALYGLTVAHNLSHMPVQGANALSQIVVAATLAGIASPLVVMAYYWGIAWVAEIYLIEDVQREGIQVYRTTPRRYAVLFPNDAIVFLSIYILGAFLLLCIWSNFDILTIMRSLVLIGIIVLLRSAVLLAANVRLRSLQSTYLRWKIDSMATTFVGNFGMLAYGFYWAVGFLGAHTVARLFVHRAGSIAYPFAGTYPSILGGPTQLVLSVVDYNNPVAHFRALVQSQLVNDSVINYVLGRPRFSGAASLVIPMMVVGVAVVFLCMRAIDELANNWDESESLGVSTSQRPPRVNLHAVVSSRLVKAAIAVDWMLTVVMVGLGLWTAAVALCWIAGLAILSGEVAPFRALQTVLQIPLGSIGGALVARCVVVASVGPFLLWCVLWSVSVGERVVTPLRERRRTVEVPEGARLALESLCDRARMAVPRLEMDATSGQIAKTMLALSIPRQCTIRLSPEATTLLSGPRLEAVLAHELGHVRLHAWKLWLVEALSVISLLPRGHLTLLLDFRKLELEADEFAWRLTGNFEALEQMLRQSADLEEAASVRLYCANAPGVTRTRLGRILARVESGRIYRLFARSYKHFFDRDIALRGYLYPSVEERIERLQAGNSQVALK